LLVGFLLGPHWEHHGQEVRLYNPEARQWLLTRQEARNQAESQRMAEQRAQFLAEAERERLRREIEELRARIK
jgi:hypothetical protein